MSDRETVIERPSGERVTVRTDRAGTTITHEHGGGGSAGWDRHDEYVERYTSDGGRVVEPDTNN